MNILKQSTAVDVLIGPFVDKTDGATAEEAESPTVLLSKNGQTLGAKNDVTGPTHDDAGYYNCELDATDTNTVGTLVLIVEATAAALPVRHEFQVIEEATYDDLWGAAAAGIPTANETRDAVWSQTLTEPAAVPAWSADTLAALEWITALARNKITQTATTQTLRNDADAGDVATSTVSDSGGTFTRGEWS